MSFSNNNENAVRNLTINGEMSSIDLTYPVYPANSNEHELIFRTEQGQGEDIQVEKLSNGFKVILSGDWETNDFFTLMAELIKIRDLPFDKSMNTRVIVSIEPQHQDNGAYSTLFDSNVEGGSN